MNTKHFTHYAAALFILINLLGCGIVDMAVADVEWLLGYDSAPPPPSPNLPDAFAMFEPMTHHANSYKIKEGNCLYLYYQEDLLAGQMHYKSNQLLNIYEEKVLTPNGFERTDEKDHKPELVRTYTKGSQTWVIRTSRFRGNNGVSITPSADKLCLTYNI